MSKYRSQLPQLSGELFLTDGGIETDLIYSRGFELPCFASFPLLNDDKGFAALLDYYRSHATIAQKYGVGFILEAPTYRSSSDWGKELGYSEKQLAEVNHKAIKLMLDIRAEFESETSKMVISGCIGPREDAYLPNGAMSPDEAQQYHLQQIETLSDAGVDMVSAMTLNEPDEAIGITRAAQSLGIPVAISYSLETDGTLLDGRSLKDGITSVDAATNNGPAYFMINCAHPTHFESVLEQAPWAGRIRAIRANASSKSHAELWQSDKLEDGNPVELGQQNGHLARSFKHLNIFGGCCGTDHRHIEEICKSVIGGFD
jgi:S-methylmethionine-dependent homocysteine/selenocysteine methylase